MTRKTAMIRARTAPELKKEAENILSRLGLNPTEAINLFYTQIVLHKAIPFNIWLEAGEKKKNYTKVRSKKHLKKLIGL